MTAVTSPPPVASKRRISRNYWWVALVLAAVAGSVDAIGYLLLAKIFTSHVSGNTIAMALPVATKDWAQSWRHFEPIAAFFVGVMFGLATIDALARLRTSRVFAIIAAAEIVLLMAFLLVSHPAPQWAVVFPASAMGAQNGLLRRVGTRNVRITYVTGMLTDTAKDLVEIIARAIAGDRMRMRKNFADFALRGGIWLSFASGGIAGAALAVSYGKLSLLLPMLVLVALIALDLVHPFTQLHQK